MAKHKYGPSGTGTHVTEKGGVPDTEKLPTFRTDNAMKAKKGAGHVGNSNINHV